MVDSAEREAVFGALTPGTALEDALEQWLMTIAKGESGQYRAACDSVVRPFVERRAERGTETIGDLSSHDLRNFAERLNRRAWARESDPDSGITGRTAHQYYARVRAFCTYLVERDALESNPAKSVVATDELPDADVGVHEEGDQQFWSPSTRQQIVRWADWRFETAVDDGWMDAETAMRDRALVATLAYSGARGAEVFADPQNDRRNGLFWRDLDLEASEARVLGKSQDIETVVLLEPATKRLRAHKRRQNPPNESWPVFPTTHLPSLYAALPDTVDASPDTVHDLLRESDASPPSLSINGGRTVLKRLSRESGITEEGDFLLPHGARRGLGDALYDESAELAQEMLRHQSIETTHGAYRDRDTERTRTAAERALSESPGEDYDEG